METILPLISACNSTPSSASSVPVDVMLSVSFVGTTRIVVTATAALGERPERGGAIAVLLLTPAGVLSSGSTFGAATAPSTASASAVNRRYRSAGFTLSEDARRPMHPTLLEKVTF